MKHYDVCNIHKETLLSVQYSQQNFINIEKLLIKSNKTKCNIE